MANTVEIIITSEVNRALKGLGGVTKSLGVMTKVAIGAGAAIAGLTGSLFALAKTTSSVGDQFQKMSQRIGVSSQALSELSFAADLSGASIESVETGLRLLSKRMLDANQGLAEAKRTFVALGIEVTDVTGNLRSADEVFMDAVNAINQLGSETEKTALAQELFGRSGTQLLPLIKSGSAGIAEMRAEAKRLGITFNDLEANQSAAFEDALTRLGASMKGLRNTIGKALIPTLTTMSDNIRKNISSILPVVKDFASTFIGLMANLPTISQDAINLISQLFIRFFTDFDLFKSFLSNFGIVVLSMIKATTRMLLEMAQIVLKVSSVIWVPLGEAFTVIASNIRFAWQILINNLAEVMTKSAIAIADKLNTILPDKFEFDVDGLRSILTEIEKEVLKPPKTMEEAFKEGGDTILGLFGTLGSDFGIIIKELNSAFNEIKKTASSIADIPEVEEFINRTQTLLDKFAETGSQAIAEGLGATEEQSEKTKSIWDGVIEHIKENLITVQEIANETWDTFQQGIGDAFAAAIVEGESLVDAFENMLRAVIKAVISSLIQMAIQKAVFGQAVQEANSAEASSTVSGDAAQTFSGAFASVITALPYPANIAAAPGVAAGALGAMLAGTAGAAGAGAASGASIGFVGQADDGLTTVPRRGTFMLDQGERIVSAATNKDLKEAIDIIKGSGGVRGLVIRQLNIMPNSSIDEALLNKPKEFWLRVFKKGILPAMNELGSSGVTTTMQSRSGRA
jgi:hypothetical protein